MQTILAPRRQPGPIFQLTNRISHRMPNAVRTTLRCEKDDIVRNAWRFVPKYSGRHNRVYSLRAYPFGAHGHIGRVYRVYRIPQQETCTKISV